MLTTQITSVDPKSGYSHDLKSQGKSVYGPINVLTDFR